MHTTEPQTASELLSLPLEIKAEGETGVFEGYGAIFGNKDRDGDIVARGAFAESLKAGMPAMLWQHDQKAPIGKFEEVREDDKGLYVKGKLVMQGRGLEAYELLKMGALNGLSIGFVTKDARRDPATNTRTISKADLMEISLVTFPANDLARVNNVKATFANTGEPNMFETPISDTRSFERMLRENGFSRSRAKAITAKGFKAVELDADESSEIAELVSDLKLRKMALEEKGTRSHNVPSPSKRFGDWISFGVLAGDAPSQFKVKATPKGPSHITGRFELQVKYASLKGRTIGRFPAQKIFKVPAGTQEVFIRGKSLQSRGQQVWVSLLI